MDEIQQKLTLIDNQLAGRTIYQRLARTAPLFLPAVGMMVGILLQRRLDSLNTSNGSLVLWIWLAAAASAGVILLWMRVRSRLKLQGLALAASFCFLCLGAVRMTAFENPAPSDIRCVVGNERVLATIRGRIVTQPFLQPQNWCFARFASSDPPTAFYLATTAVQVSEGWQPIESTIRVRVDEPVPNLQLGDDIEAYCWLHRYEEPTNPGQFNVAEYLRLKNVHVGASIPSRDAIATTRSSRGGLAHLRKLFTGAAAGGLLDHPPSDTRTEAMLEALLLGERRHIDADTYEAFRRTGLLHLISLSGMHLCILIDLVWRFGKPLGLTKPARALVCMAATLVFLLVVPPQPPILRATVIVWAFCASILLRRQTHPLNSLSLAAVVLLLIRPTQLFEVGWQLSFAATAGILAFTHPIEQRLLAAAQNQRVLSAWEKLTVMQVAKGLGNWALRLLAVGVAAWLGSAGVLLYHFYNITPLASVWTVIAALPVTLILILGFVKILLSFILPTLSLLLGYPLSFLADALIGMVRFMATIDPTYVLIGHVPWLLIALYYALILTTAFVHPRRPVVKRVLCAAMLLMLLVPLGVMKWQRTHHSDMSLTCLDVGHGQAILARLPGAANVLFDAGSLSTDDIGSRVVLPFLDHEGIDRLHAVVVSHRDIDHINGLPEIVNRRTVDCVYFDPVSFTQSQDVATIRVLMDHLASRRVPTSLMPETLDAGRARIRLLWPTAESITREKLSDNDKSLVCLIEWSDATILLCSDIETLAQREILALHEGLKPDVIVAPHHGSIRTLDGRFIEQLDPRVIVCSCARRDYEQGRMIQTSPGRKLLITARDGAISVCIAEEGMIKACGSKHK
ncbi:MAG TPA: ComEC/Rec2 family competence protein [Sedimentisphaerales bacterium]|nr:ComEC/Rec2 family competence protein [Sedimentisphaerales bacterium]